MKYFFFALLFSCLIPFLLFSQNEIVPYSTQLIVAGKYETANHYLDSILKIHPDNIDALIMKGNVVLNYSVAIQPDSFFITADNETVFDTADNLTGVKIVPPATVNEVEKYWRRCLRIDSSRVDVHKGLCTLYSMALMEEPLKSEILEVIKWEKNEDGQQAYRLADYARKFKERNRFNEAMEVYQFISQKFPELAGIRCDMAWEYFYRGRMNDALRYLDSALSKKTIDESTYLNAAFAYSELGYFDNAYRCLADYSKTYNTKMNLFYKGLMLFANADPGYEPMLKYFLGSVDSGSYFDEYTFARALLQYTDSFTLNNFQHLIDAGYKEYYLPLVYQRAMHQFQGRCEPFVEYGIYQASIKNYSAAVQFLEEGGSCELPQPLFGNWLLDYGYTFFETGDTDKATALFRQLLTEGDPFKQQAARYFLAKIDLAGKQPHEAKKLLDEINSSGMGTKYANFVKYLELPLK